MFKILLILGSMICLYANSLYRYESQPHIIKYNKITIQKGTKDDIKVKFNRAVLYLEQNEYLKAIRLFKQTAKKIRVPSFLNIGIAYFKLNSLNNSYLYLKKLYDLKDLANYSLYSYVSASYYLYQITKDRKYLNKLLNSINHTKTIDEYTKLLVIDTYIILKKYKKAIKISLQLKEINDLKLALLYMNVKNYTKSEIRLKQALGKAYDEKKINQILWFQIYLALKTNNINKINNYIEIIEQRIDLFKIYPRMPIKIYFNKDKYNSKYYFKKILKFDDNRKIDILFYFLPFIFSDDKSMEEESKFAFILNEKNSLKSLNLMNKYNKDFINIVKLDPIIRANKLQKELDNKTNIKAYEYYNLAVAYGQIFSYQNAYNYFLQAYRLNRANKLYNVMVQVSAKQVNIQIKNKIKIDMINNLKSSKGDYRYFGKKIYQTIIDKHYKIDETKVDKKVSKTIFYRSLQFLNDTSNNKNRNLLLNNDYKDQLVFLFDFIIQRDGETRYEYISRLQDYIPKFYNEYFLQGPLIITEYYIDILRALGVFHKVNFDIIDRKTPTYQRTKALVDLYNNKAINTIKIIESLQDRYNLEDKKIFNLLIAGYLSINDYSNASATLGMLQFELKDSNARFLNGVQLINNLKLNSAKISFKKRYDGTLIDIKMVGLNKFLENLE